MKLFGKKKKENLYFFFNYNCTYCNKVMPFVDELIKDGYNIQKFDVNEPENKDYVTQIKQKHNIQCGVPLFINGDSGNYICGFREKDILQKWVNGEEIPKPPAPKSPPPQPFRPNATEDEINKWKTKYEDWANENAHLPNIKQSDDIIKMLKAQYAQQNQQHKFNTQFYYIVENNEVVKVVSTPQHINTLRRDYYVRENNGMLTKVVGVGGESKKTNQPQITNPKQKITTKPNPEVDRKPTKQEQANIKKMEQMIENEKNLKLPSNVQMARNLTKEVWKNWKSFVKGNKLLTAPEKAIERMKICETCEFANIEKNKKGENVRCSECGCFMDIKTNLEASECPKKKW